MRTRPLVIVALVAATAIALPAQAAPPSGAGDRTAPYSGYGSHSARPFCDTGAVCTSTGSVDSLAGRLVTSSTFDRTVPAAGEERSLGYATQLVGVKVPPKVDRVTAVFEFAVQDTSVFASSSGGLIMAYTGVGAYAANCSSGCAQTSAYQQVQYAGTIGGAPSPGLAPSETGATLTVTVTGDLPRFLQLGAYAFSAAAGRASQACVTDGSCQTVSETHAGSSRSSIDAALTRVSVSFG